MWSVNYVANVLDVLHVNVTKNIQIILKQVCNRKRQVMFNCSIKAYFITCVLKHILLLVSTSVICNILEVTVSDMHY